MDRRPLDDFTASQRALVKAAQSRLASTARVYSGKSGDARQVILARQYAKLVNEYGDAVAAAAARMYERLRPSELGVFTAEVADRYSDKQITGMFRQAGLGRNQRQLEMSLQKALMDQGRATVVHNMRRDSFDVRWARVPSGSKTCAFCTMLASRGWVYASEESAGRRGHRFHAGCDCMIVPSWDAGTVRLKGYDPDRMYEQYRVAVDRVGVGASANDIAREMRALFPDAFTDSHVPVEKKKEPGPKPRSIPGKISVSSKVFKEWAEHSLDGISDVEVRAIRAWTTKAYEDLQQRLIEGRPLSEDQSVMVERIDAVLSRSKIPADVELHRRDSLARFGISSIEEVESIVDKVFDSPGYLAVTSRRGGVKTNPDAIVKVHITVLEGTNAAYIGKISDKPKQRETLIIRGKVERVREIDIDDGGTLHIYIDLE